MKLLKATLWVIGGLLLALVALVLIMSGILPGREQRLNEAWGKTLVSLDEMSRQFPRVDDSASALEVEKLAAPLGLCMAPGGGECKRSKPADADKKAVDAILNPADKTKGLSDWLNAQLEKSAGGIDPAPEGLQKYLTDRSAGIAALRDALLKGEPPRWAYDPDKGYAMEIPNLLGQMNLNRLLLADALVALREGREAQALDDLNASWRLHEESGNSPALVCRLIAINVERMQLGVVRRFDAPPAGWEERLETMDPRRSVAIAIEAEAWMMQRSIVSRNMTALRGEGGADGHAAPADRIPDFIQRPYLRLSVVETSDAMRKSLEKYRVMDPCEVAAHKPAPDETLAGLSWWNVLGKIAMPDYQTIWARAGRATLELELTRKLLAARGLRHAAKDGAWPAAVAAIGDSSCKAGKWSYQAGGDGTMTLAFSPQVDWGKRVNGANIPLSVTEPAPAAGSDRPSSK